MLEQNPDARFILNVRSKGEWILSRLGWRRGYEDFRLSRELLHKLAPYRECACDRMVPMVEQDSALLGITQERVPDFWLAEWNEHVARVKREIPEDRLLVYDIRSDPRLLCEFAGLPPECARHYGHWNRSDFRGPITRAVMNRIPKSIRRLVPAGLRLRLYHSKLARRL